MSTSALRAGILVLHSLSAQPRDWNPIPVVVLFILVMVLGIWAWGLHTHLRKTRSRLAEIEKQLAESHGAFHIERLSILGHEIRSPVSVLRSFIEMLPDRYGDEEFRNTLVEIGKSETNRVLDLLDRLLDLSRPSLLRAENVNLENLLSQVIGAARPGFEEAGLSLEIGVQGSPELLGDASALHRVFENLLRNAREASPRGGKVTVDCVPAKGGHGYRVSICDTGSGIPPDRIEKIFEAFFTTKQKGTGLGLAISRKIVEEHGGCIEVHSMEGQGTRFDVFLPEKGKADPDASKNRNA